jgi:hypothetical protein
MKLNVAWDTAQISFHPVQKQHERTHKYTYEIVVAVKSNVDYVHYYICGVAIAQSL